ncbi:MAG: glycosyltransferase family 2 protein [Methanomicrobiales archaeon]
MTVSDLTETRDETKRTHDDIVAVIPAYNEELTIGSVLLLAAKHVSRCIVVDDGSNDRTTEIARAAGATVIVLPENRGKAHALFQGLNAARSSNPDVVVLMDADGQNNPGEIPALIVPITRNEADLVIGSRFLGTASDIPAYRKIGQKTLNYATNMQSEYDGTDSQSGFRALSRKALDYFDFTSEGYNIESDMISHFMQTGLVIVEVPISVRYDVPNKHKKNPLTHGYDVIANIIGEIGYRRPLMFFGILGILCILAGTTAGFWAISFYYLNNMLPFGPTIASVLFVILGMLLLISGLILNSLIAIMKNQRLQ